MTNPVLRPNAGATSGEPTEFSPGLPWLGRLKSRRALRFQISGIAVLLDGLAIATAYVVVSLFRLETVDVDQLGRILVSLLPIVLLFNLNNQAFSIEVLRDRTRSAWRGASGLIWATLLLLLIFFFLKISEEFSRIVLATGTILAALLITLARGAIADFCNRALGPSPLASICIYDGMAPLEADREGVVIASEVDLRPDPGDPEALERLGRLADGIDGIVVHCPPERRAQWAFMLKSLDVATEIVVPELTGMQPLAIRNRSGHASLVLGSGQLLWSQRVLKRAFDLAVTLAALPVLLPVLLLIAAAIKLDSRGPVLFRQDRIGLGNRKFRILKFRTMHVDQLDEKAEKSTSRDDPRVTRVGAVLRRTSLDELPQFINVLLGDMSIVGPRPHAERTAVGSALLWEIDAAYWHRHVVKPGITGLAQVRGHRGSLFDEQQLRQRLNADLEYVANWSLVRDVKIIIQTLGVVIHRNAF